MEFEPNHIDDIFRQRLHNAEVPPPAFVWPNVERELQKRKRRRFFLWLFAFGVASAGLWTMFTRQQVSTPVAAKTQQGFSENKAAETPAAVAEQQKPSEIPTPEPQKSVAKAATPGAFVAPGANAAIENWSAKGGDLQDGLSAQNAGMVLNYPAAPTEVPTSSQPDQALRIERDFTDFMPLETTAPEPLAFSRKSDFPQAKTFIRKKKDPKYCYDFAQNPNVWMLDVYAGPSFSKRTLEASDPSFDGYAQMRSTTEQTDWAFNAGLRGSLLLGRHFLVRSGLHYEQMTEVFEYADPNYIKYIIEVTQILEGNEWVTIIDTVGVEYGENYTKTYNRYGLLDIPLEMGGEIRSGRFGLSINAGVSFNVLFWKRGTILSPAGQPTPFTPGEKGATEIFRPRTGLSAGASGQFFFHLQPRLRVFAEPYYRQILKPITLDNQPVEQRYSNWGIKIGMTKILD